MFLLIEPSIFIRLSSVIPFWKAEGLTILMVWINFDEKLWPMRNQHLKIAYPRGRNFLLPPRIKNLFSQNTLFFKDIFGSKFFFPDFGPRSPPKKPTFWIKHFREKLKKVYPHYFSILNGVSFLHFFPEKCLRKIAYFVKKKIWSEGEVKSYGPLDRQFSSTDFSLVKAFHQNLFTTSK